MYDGVQVSWYQNTLNHQNSCLRCGIIGAVVKDISPIFLFVLIGAERKVSFCFHFTNYIQYLQAVVIENCDRKVSNELISNISDIVIKYLDNKKSIETELKSLLNLFFIIRPTPSEEETQKHFISLWV